MQAGTGRRKFLASLLMRGCGTSVVALLLAAPLVAQDIYWIEAGPQAILRKTAGGPEELIATGLTLPLSLAVDESAGYLFWIDAFDVQRSELDGSRVTTIGSSPGEIPHSIDLDPVSERVYTMGGGSGRLRSRGYGGADLADLGGAADSTGLVFDSGSFAAFYPVGSTGIIQRMSFANGTDTPILDGLVTPHDLALHPGNQQLFWVSGLNRIQRANTDGSDLVTLFTSGTLPDAVTSLAVDPGGDQLYLAMGREIYRCALDGSGLELVYSGAKYIVNLTVTSSAAPEFVRGDGNGDGIVDIGDAVSTLAALFISSGDPLACGSAGDCNDDGVVDLSDAVRLLSSLFVSGSPQLPAPAACGADPTPDSLLCESYDLCP